MWNLSQNCTVHHCTVLHWTIAALHHWTELNLQHLLNCFEPEKKVLYGNQNAQLYTELCQGWHIWTASTALHCDTTQYTLLCSGRGWQRDLWTLSTESCKQIQKPIQIQIYNFCAVKGINEVFLSAINGIDRLFLRKLNKRTKAKSCAVVKIIVMTMAVVLWARILYLEVLVSAVYMQGVWY